MKLLYSIIIILAFAGLASGAEPLFMTCDPQAGVTQYKIIWEDGIEEIVPAQSDGSIRRDVADIPIGERSGVYMAGRPWTVDGVPQEAMEWSPSVPFVLGRPSVPKLPSGTGLSK